LEKRKMGYFVAPFILDLYHFRCVCNSISYEGMMPIREGAAENQFYSDKTFLTVVDGDL
jgi:hypothetical protein